MEVIFFPRKDYDVQVCNHRFGKKMTYTEQTDCFPIEAVQIAELAKLNGIKCGVFASYLNDGVGNDKLVEYCNNNNLWADLYFYGEYTSSGTEVTNEQFNSMYKANIDFFKNLFGEQPIAISYANGNISYKEFAKELFLGGRQSSVNYKTDYGFGVGNPSDIPYTKDNWIAHPCTTRVYDSALPDLFDRALEVHAQRIDDAYSSGGWLHNFTHWHDVVKNGHLNFYERYFNLLKSKNQNNDIYFAGWGEALSYMVYRELLRDAVMYSPIGKSNTMVIRLNATNNIGINADLLRVPISVKFTTIGTPLEGKQIVCDRRIVDLGSEEYIVEIPYSRFPSATIIPISRIN